MFKPYLNENGNSYGYLSPHKKSTQSHCDYNQDHLIKCSVLLMYHSIIDLNSKANQPAYELRFPFSERVVVWNKFNSEFTYFARVRKIIVSPHDTMLKQTNN